MKRLSIILLIMTAVIVMNAREKNFTQININKYDLIEFAKTRIDNDLKHRTDKLQVVPMKGFLLGDTELFWTDGLDVFSTMYEDEIHEVRMTPTHFYDSKRKMCPTGPMSVKGNNVYPQKTPDMKVTVERLGEYTMLVVRNSQNIPVKSYYYMTNEELNNNYWALFLPILLAGNYTTADGKNVVFGPKMPFYTGDKYDCDPGFYSHYVMPDFSSIYIAYGAGRVNHGDPSSPKYGKMPGGGGAGALMGPMEWNVTITIDGLLAKVTCDQKFVDHNPRIDKETELTKVQCPYEGIDGKWAFASVIPLTHSLLKLFPADVLTLMRGEIYARHGDTFNNPETQRYFDAQPWYKRSGKPVKLTNLERFNYALIKQVEHDKKNNQ
ncbi:MAG: YARHG domain-containing protein [Muribaculaceae bacterium]|nr:YARHG domain-containing protein [Muribaculaceae bacterium]